MSCLLADSSTQFLSRIIDSTCALKTESADANSSMHDHLNDVAEMECDGQSTDASGDFEDASTNALHRTTSQVQKHFQVQAVLQRQREHQRQVEQLKEHSSLVLVSATEKKNPAGDINKMFQECRKMARNLGEDLIDDTLALDSLTSLFGEDRNTRKSVILRLEALLEDVDKLKSQLLSAEKEYQAWMEPGAAGQTAAAEALEIQPTCEDSEEDDAVACESSSAFERTLSQVEKQTQVQSLMQRLEKHDVSSERLQEKVSRLVARVSQKEACLEDERKVVEDCRKEARNHEQDLLEDMVSLDKLSGLYDEDRSNRKKMIASLDERLGQVDKVKVELATLQKDLEARLEAVANHADTQHAALASPEVPDAGSGFWKALDVPLRFRSADEGGCYTLVAQSGAIRADEVNLELSADASRLTVSGTHFPLDFELMEMRHRIEQHLSQIGQQSCDLHAAQQMYYQLGNGLFGSFSQSFELRRDVDANRIQATCNDGVLCVTLPKRIRQARPSMRHPHMSGGAYRSPFF